jgi:enoyl-CoA hydratase
MLEPFFTIEQHPAAHVLCFRSADNTNRLTRERVLALTQAVRELAQDSGGPGKAPHPLVITGNEHFFSAGAELDEVSRLTGPAAYDFSLMGQALMQAVDDFPAPVIAAVRGYCMGGGLDLALACELRIAHPHAIFGHRGAALGLITGWGGTQRLPRLIGKALALEIFLAAEKVTAKRALEIGLVSAVCDNPVMVALNLLSGKADPSDSLRPKNRHALVDAPLHSSPE